MGGAAGAGVPPPGQGAAEADRRGRVPQHAVQLHAWATTAWSSSSPRPSCRARTASAATRCRPARSGRSAPAGRTRAPGLYRIEVTEGPGSGVRILNQPPPAPFRESVRVRRAEPLFAGARTGRRPQPARARVHRPAARIRCGQERCPSRGSGIDRPVLGSAGPIRERWARHRWGPQSRRFARAGAQPRSMLWNWPWRKVPAWCCSLSPAGAPLVDLSDDVAARVQSLFYLDPADAFRKALTES